MKNDRRDFLKTVGGVPLALAGSSAAGQDRGEVGRDGSAAAAPRASGTSRFALEVDGASVGVLNGYAGGTVGAEVVEEGAGEGGVIGKHLGRLQYEDLSLITNSTLLKPPFSNWVADTLGRNFMPHDGFVRALDQNSKLTRETQFSDGLLTEVGFPSFEGGGKEAALFRFLIKPRKLEVKAGDGGSIAVPMAKGKAALSSSYRLTIDGLANAVKKVSKIDAFRVKMQVLYFGDEGCAPQEFGAGPLAIDDLVIHCAESAAKELYDWQEEFVIKGACDGQSKGERSGTLELLSADFKTVLLTIQFKGLGLHDLSLEARGNESISQVVARMYCEQVALKA